MISKDRLFLIWQVLFSKALSKRASLFYLLKSRDKIFREIYRRNMWGDKSSVSGPGSNLKQTEIIRKMLPVIIKELNFDSILDIPCGDFYWMKLIDLDIAYIGGDIVAEIIENNEKQYSNHQRMFIKVDVVKDKLPKSDLLLCRDCLVHFSDQDVFKTIRNIKRAGIKFLLATTFVSKNDNANILTGSWRPINLQKPPFNFPDPIKMISEECPIEKYRDKSLGLWKIEDLPSFG